MSYSDSSNSSLGNLVQDNTRPPVPEDNLCQTCHHNPQKYYKKHQYVCLHCWDRDEYPNLADKTDQELDAFRAENLKRIKEDETKVSIVNANNLKHIGF